MLYLRFLNKILHRIYLTFALRGFEYTMALKLIYDLHFLRSEYIKVVNMSGFIKETLHHRDA